MNTDNDPDAVFNTILQDKEARQDLVIAAEDPIDMDGSSMEVAMALNPRLELVSKAIQNLFPGLPFVLVLTSDGETAVTITSLDDFQDAVEILAEASEKLQENMETAAEMPKVH